MRSGPMANKLNAFAQVGGKECETFAAEHIRSICMAISLCACAYAVHCDIFMALSLQTIVRYRAAKTISARRSMPEQMFYFMFYIYAGIIRGTHTFY